MPVTAKLSRRFYETLGDEITNELVDWMNSVDATYQSSLRELNEMNFARFDAKLEQRIAAVESRIDELDKKIDGLDMSLRSYIEARLSQQNEATVTRLASFESRMLRWMIGLWTVSILTTAGFFAAIMARS